MEKLRVGERVEYPEWSKIQWEREKRKRKEIKKYKSLDEKKMKNKEKR